MPMNAQHKIRILILKVAIDATGPRVLIFFSLVIYDHERAKLAVQLKTIDEILDLLHLLTRDSNKEKHQNKLTFLEEFIKNTGLFPELASPKTLPICGFGISKWLAFPTIDIRS
jgi:hypothetical protein